MPIPLLDQLDKLDEALRKRDRLTAELKHINDRVEKGDDAPGLKTRSANLLLAADRLDEEINRLRSSPLDDLEGDPGQLEGGAEPGAVDGRRPVKTKDLVLAKDQPLVGWLKAKGHLKAKDEGLSFGRYIKGLATGDWTDQPELKAMSEGTLTAGGHLVPTPLSANVIDLARNQSRVFQAGATLVPMTAATLKIARLTGEGTPAWRGENAAITAADLSFDAVTFTARSLARMVTLSVELFDDADPGADGVIERSFAAQLALELDRVALRGSGTAPEPRGILNQTGVTLLAHGVNGSTIGSPPAAGVMGWEFLVDSAATIRNANFEPTSQIMAPRTPQSLAKLRDTTNQYIAPPSYLDDLPRLQTKQVPTNLTVGTSTDCSEVYTGQWNMLAVGIRTTFQIQFLRERFIDSGQYAFLAWLRADIQLFQPAAFAVDTGVRS